MGQQEAAVRGHADDHGLHQDPAHVLPVAERADGGAGGAQAGHMAASAQGLPAPDQHRPRRLPLRRHPRPHPQPHPPAARHRPRDRERALHPHPQASAPVLVSLHQRAAEAELHEQDAPGAQDRHVFQHRDRVGGHVDYSGAEEVRGEASLGVAHRRRRRTSGGHLRQV